MVEAKDIRTGDWIVFNREPYKVVRKEIVTAGTHMHSKSKLIMRGMFSPGEKSQVYGHHDKLDIAELEFKSGQVISVGAKVQLMDTRTYETFEVDPNPEVEVTEGMVLNIAHFNGKLYILRESR